MRQQEEQDEGAEKLSRGQGARIGEADDRQFQAADEPKDAVALTSAHGHQANPNEARGDENSNGV